MINKFFSYIKPPLKWNIPVLAISGTLFGIAVFLVYISKAPSYLSDDPKTCVNCHVMAPQYATWEHSSHRERATCNDCHVPHDNFFDHYYFKAKDGLRHATIFTLRKEPQVIMIKDEGKKVVQENCIRCHEDLISNNQLMGRLKNFQHTREDRKCWDCHQEVPHGKVNSLTSVPNARVPLPESPLPKWLRENK